MTDERRAATPELTAICLGMEDDYRAAVVKRVLEWRKRATGNAERSFNNAERSFNAALAKAVRIKGFRKPHKAPDHALQPEILRCMNFSAALLGSVLQIWMESQEELRGAVSEHLTGAGLAPEGLNFEENRFTGCWSIERWMREREKFATSHDQFCGDDIALMLCCVSGKMPVPAEHAIEEPSEPRGATIFSQWLEELRATPADAPQWEEAASFVESANEIIRAKEDERNTIRRLKATLTTLKQEFARELAFFQCDVDSWSLERLPGDEPTTGAATPDGAAEFLRLTERLNDLLADYKPVHDMAPVITEELALGPKRLELQRQILECALHITQRFSGAQDAEEERPRENAGEASPAPEAETAGPDGQTGKQSDAAAPQNNGRASSSIGTQTGQPPSADSSADGEIAAASTAEAGSAGHEDEETVEKTPVFSLDDYASLESDYQKLRQENEALTSELKSAQDVAKTWRVAWEKARKELAQSGEAPREDEFLSIEDVRTAVALAKEKFAKELLFQPNSKSEIQDNLFEKPQKVYTALEWLATTFYRSKMGKDSVPDFDKSIRDACGWWYTGNQSESTMSRYKPWYTTCLDGKEYWLKKHIGTGSNKAARYTIRIAFEWDEERQVVVVGYIGQHQQTNAT